jgi:hypothetical protein
MNQSEMLHEPGGRKRKSWKWLSPREEQAIVADRASGLSLAEIGEKYHRSRQAVARALARFKQNVPEAVVSQGVAVGYRERLRDKSIRSIERALDSDRDEYKSANVAVSVMKGIGEFNEQQAPTGSLSLLIASMPPGLLPRFAEALEPIEANAINVTPEPALPTSAAESDAPKDV